MGFMLSLPVVLGVSYVVYCYRYRLLQSPQLVHNPYMVSWLHSTARALLKMGLQRWFPLPAHAYVAELEVLRGCCGGQVELRARRLLAELESSSNQGRDVSGHPVDVDQKAREDAERHLAILLVSLRETETDPVQVFIALVASRVLASTACACVLLCAGGG